MTSKRVNITRKQDIITAVLFCTLAFASVAQSAEPLPSWNDGKTKQAILTFVSKVTKIGAPEFVPPAERIATFDNDGTLWAEQPLYFQLLFAVDRVKQLAPAHPEWKEKEPFKSVLAGDLKAAFAGGQSSLIEIVGGGQLKHATGGVRPHRKELDRHCEAPQDRTPVLGDGLPADARIARLSSGAMGSRLTLSSGGGAEFMRAFSERVYGIPPEQVIGSTGKLQFEIRDGKPSLIRMPALDFFDDKEDKPIAIQRHIGRRPIAAFGNSDGDLPMLRGPVRERARASASSFATPTPSASGATTCHPWADLKKDLRKPTPKAGRWLT